MTAATGPFVVAYVVAKGKKELGRRVVRVDGDSVTEQSDGQSDGAPAADVTFTMTPDVAADFDAGTLDVAVGFMRGTIKMAGDTATLLRVLPALRSTPARLRLALPGA